MLSQRRQVLTGLGGLGLLAGCGSRRGMLFGTDTHPADYPTVRAFRRFGDLMETRSNGRLRLNLFPDGQLGAERDTLEITIFGGLDFNRVNLAPLNSIEPLTLVPALPFLFDDVAHMRRTLDGDVGARILAAMLPHGLIGLAFYDSGARSIYNSQRPIHAPADLAGLKIRVPNSDLFVATINALGANATPMDLSEVYQAIVQGVIDGAENNLPSFETGRHFEVARHLSLTSHVIGPEVLLMAKSSWDRLTAADQEIVMTCARESVPYMRELWDARVLRAEATLRAAGVAINAVERAPFRALVQPVWQQFMVGEGQKALLRATQDLTGAAYA
jgi:tripartite ATP-independent transporter DctP family solute receptor